MPVPQEDTLCRFIRPRDWNKGTGRPSQRAFAQPGLSVWDLERLTEHEVSIDDLRIEHLAGCGQSQHTAEDYARFAVEAAESEKTPFRVSVEWRPEDEYVAEPWRPWAYAHVQVEAVEGPPNFLLEFRRLLALNARHLVPPD